MARHWEAAVVLLAAIAASASVATAATILVRSSPGPSLSLGEEIFTRGIGPDGQPIAHTGGVLGVVVGGCASCHGSNGHGLLSLGIVPNITYANLTNPRGMLRPDGRRGPAFIDQTIRRAITAGVDPGGVALTPAMPRWRLTGQEWAGLLAYLKTLK
jgi:cytochrome c oxidase subunit 2